MTVAFRQNNKATLAGGFCRLWNIDACVDHLMGYTTNDDNFILPNRPPRHRTRDQGVHHRLDVNFDITLQNGRDRITLRDDLTVGIDELVVTNRPVFRGLGLQNVVHTVPLHGDEILTFVVSENELYGESSKLAGLAGAVNHVADFATHWNNSSAFTSL